MVLFVDGDVILSQKGTTQGYSLAMAMYGLATIPLIRRPDGLCTQVQYADDAMAARTQRLVGQTSIQWSILWLFILQTHSKHEQPIHLEEASVIFADSGINITPTGRPYLGAAIGLQEFTIVLCKIKCQQVVLQSCPSWKHCQVTAMCHICSTNTYIWATEKVDLPQSSYPQLLR